MVILHWFGNVLWWVKKLKLWITFNNCNQGLKELFCTLWFRLRLHLGVQGVHCNLNLFSLKFEIIPIKKILYTWENRIRGYKTCTCKFCSEGLQIHVVTAWLLSHGPQRTFQHFFFISYRMIIIQILLDKLRNYRKKLTSRRSIGLDAYWRPHKIVTFIKQWL